MSAVSESRRRRAAEAFQEFLQRRARGGAESSEAFLLAHDELFDLLEPMVRDLSVRSGAANAAPAAGARAEAEGSKPSGQNGDGVEGERLGDFRVIREVGRGGMGVVYEAEQISLGRVVALKVLPAHLTLRRDVIERFRREASTVAKLRHPGIVEVYAIGEAAGAHFFAMEFIEGTPLDKVIELLQARPSTEFSGSRIAAIVSSASHRRASTLEATDEPHIEDVAPIWSRTYVETVCQLVAQVADALEHAHRAGVIHRDVKPANILVRVDGSTVLTDFGLARDEGTSSMTLTGEFAGTPYYVSPEQAMARRAKVDHRTDVYSLGVTLFELLTRRRPFEGRTPQEVLGAIVTKEPPNPRKLNPLLPRDLVTITLKAIERDPDRRYASAAALASDLRAFLAFRPITARPATLATRIVKLTRRNRAATAFTAAMLLMAAVLGVGWFLRPGVLVVESPTRGAMVFVDGEARGTVPLSLEITPGVHRVRLEKADEQLASAEEQIVVARGATQSLSRMLASLYGVAVLDSDPPGARVTLVGDSGKSLVVKETTPTRFDAPQGRYRARFELPGFESQEKALTILPGGVRTPCSAEWKTGELVVDGVQVGAQIDVFRGATCGAGAPVASVTLPQASPVRLPTGVYSLRARLASHERQDVDGPRAVRVEASRVARAGVWLAPVDAREWLRPSEPLIEVVDADLDGDDRRELIVATLLPSTAVPQGFIRLFGPDGRVRTTSTKAPFLRRLHTVNVDASGRKAVITITPFPVFTRFSFDGQPNLDVSMDIKPVCSAVADVDGDGRDEVVIAGGVYLDELRNVRSRERGSSRPSGKEGKCALFSSEGERRFEHATQGEVSQLAVVDLDGDGRLEIVAGTQAGRVVAWAADGSPRWDAKIDGNVDVLMALDLDGDGRHAIVACSPFGNLSAFRPDGALRFEARLDGQARVAIDADLDARGHREPILGTSTGNVVAVAGDGSRRFSTPLKGQITSLIATHLDGDGKPELVAGTSLGKVAAILPSGAPLWTTQVVGSVVKLFACDLDGDARSEVVAGTSTGHVIAFERDGTPRFEMRADGEIARLLTADPAGDGTTSLVVATTTGQILALATDRARRFETKLEGETALAIAAPMEADGPPALISAAKTGECLATAGDGSARFDARLEGAASQLLQADLDGDRAPETIVATAEGRVVALDGRGAVRFDVDLKRPNPVIAAGDLDGDGRAEVVATGLAGVIVAIAADGSKRFETATGVLDGMQELLVADLDGDGRSEIVAGSEVGDVLFLDAAGAVRARAKLKGSVTSLSALEREGGRGRDVVVTCYVQVVLSFDSLLTVLGADGSVRAQAKLPGQIRGRVLIADVDGDGRKEIVVANGLPDIAPIVIGKGRITAFSPDGTRGIRIDVPGDLTSLAAQDLDGEKGLELIAGFQSGRLKALRRDGATIFERRLDGPVTALREIRVARDQPPCVLAATKSGQILVLERDGPLRFERHTKGVLVQLEVVDLEGDGVDEIVTWDHLGNVIAWAQPTSDVRLAARRSFLDGLAAAERGDDAAAASRFRGDRLAWIGLDESLLTNLRLRLVRAASSPAAAAERVALDRVRPPSGTDLLETIRALVEGKKLGDAVALAQTYDFALAAASVASETNDFASLLLKDGADEPERVALASALASAVVAGDARRTAAYLDTLADAKLAAGDRAGALLLKREALSKCPADRVYFREALQKSIEVLEHP